MVVGNKNQNKKMRYDMRLKLFLELSIELNHSYKLKKTSVELETYILGNLCRGYTPEKCLNFN